MFQRILDENYDAGPVLEEIRAYWSWLRWGRATALMTLRDHGHHRDRSREEFRNAKVRTAACPAQLRNGSGRVPPRPPGRRSAWWPWLDMSARPPIWFTGMTEAASRADNDRDPDLSTLDRVLLPAPRVAYVMTHYPNPSQTFLLREVVALDGDGLTIERISINRLEVDALQTDEERREARATFHVKALHPVVVVTAMIALAARRPGGFLRALLGALRPVATDPRLAVRRLFHFAEAILVWNHCRARSVEHIHAQFGGLPATVAMLVASLAEHVDQRVDLLELHDPRLPRLRRGAGAGPGREVGLRFVRPLRQRPIALTAHASRRHQPLGSDPRRPLRRRRRPPRASSDASLGLRRLSCSRSADWAARRATPPSSRRLRSWGSGVDRSACASSATVRSGPASRPMRSSWDSAHGVEMLGSCSPAEVEAALRSADLFCLPSFAEGIPVAIMEAMAVGVPVVSTAVRWHP